jgi:dTDP-4-dehydrorhamnose reductase
LSALPKQCRFIHISTDAVFGGSKGNYSEQEPAEPVHVYGKTKLQAEEAVLRERPQALVVRTVFIGMNRHPEGSLTQWFLDRLKNKADCPGFTDVYFSPIEVGLLANRILELMGTQAAGRLHVAGREGCSKYAFAKQLAKLFGFSEEKVRPVVSESLSVFPPRPKNVTLNISLAESLLGRQLPSLDESLRALMEPVAA